MIIREFDFQKLGAAFSSRLKYGDSLRRIAKEMEVSAATLSRLKRGYPVDPNTIIRVCDWTGDHITEFIKQVK